MKKIKEKVYYDKKTDVLWLMVKPGPEDKHQEIAPGISVELDKNGQLLGIEILNASTVLGSKLRNNSNQQTSRQSIPAL